ncbi:MAG: CvpA family protein [Clostridia bacterium]|nr:CvpA family protein [Clostridia bacterium]
MEKYVDIALIVIFAFIIIFNFIRGFAKSLMPLRKWAALAGAWILKGPIGELLSASLPIDSWKTALYERSYAMFGERINQVTAEAGGEVTAESFSGIFGMLESVFSGIKELCVQSVKDGVTDVAHTVSVFISENLIRIGVQAVAFVGLFLVLMIVLTVVLKILDSVCKDNILGLLNRLLGAVIGLPVAFITVWVISLVLLFFFPEMLAESKFAAWLCNEFFLSKFFGIGTVV